MDDISKENYDLSVNIVLDIMGRGDRYRIVDKTKRYIEAAEDYQGEVREKDFFNFLGYLKRCELPKVIPDLGATLHQYLNIYKWDKPYEKRDIRDLEDCDEMLKNVLGAYANSSLSGFFGKIFKNSEVSSAVQLIIEKNIEEFYKENREEVFEGYDRYLEKEKRITKDMYQ